jgi:signal transduction histidine kinase
VNYFSGVRHWPLVRRHFFDALIVFGAAGGILEMILTRGDSAESPQGPLWVLLLVPLVLTTPLLFRRRFVFAAPAVAILGAGALSFIEGSAIPNSFFTFLAVLTCSFLLGMLGERRQALIGLLLLIAVGAVVTRNDPNGAIGDYLFTTIIFSASWLAGLALSRRLEEAEQAQQRAVRAEQEREERAGAAVAEERQRIARELHDVVAHSVSVMTVQAGGVRRLLRPEQERERDALEQIELTGRQALAEMRRLLGILRQPAEMPTLAPQPGVGSLGALIEQVREAGLPVEYRIKGEPVRLPPGIDLSAYRIVQEALTNALKYAGPAHARVAVRYGTDVIELEIENDGDEDGVDGEGSGHGLVGMKERVALYGGRLESGPRRGGGYSVRARLPVRESA